MSCDCYKIGGPWIAEDPDCPEHRILAQRERKEHGEREAALESRIQQLEAELKRKDEILAQVSRVAHGEDQVADDDTEGMAWIANFIDEHLADVDAVVIRDDAVIESIKMDGSGMEMIMRHPLFFEWTKDMLELFDEKGAINFLELCCGTPDRGNFTVTIQRLEGKRPGQIVHDLDKRLDQGRHYLMGVDADKITVEDALEAFGFGRDGLGV